MPPSRLAVLYGPMWPAYAAAGFVWPPDRPQWERKVVAFLWIPFMVSRTVLVDLMRLIGHLSIPTSDWTPVLLHRVVIAIVFVTILMCATLSHCWLIYRGAALEDKTRTAVLERVAEFEASRSPVVDVAVLTRDSRQSGLTIIVTQQMLCVFASTGFVLQRVQQGDSLLVIGGMFVVDYLMLFFCYMTCSFFSSLMRLCCIDIVLNDLRAVDNTMSACRWSVVFFASVIVAATVGAIPIVINVGGEAIMDTVILILVIFVSAMMLSTSWRALDMYSLVLEQDENLAGGGRQMASLMRSFWNEMPWRRGITFRAGQALRRFESKRSMFMLNSGVELEAVPASGTVDEDADEDASSDAEEEEQGDGKGKEKSAPEKSVAEEKGNRAIANVVDDASASVAPDDVRLVEAEAPGPAAQPVEPASGSESASAADDGGSAGTSDGVTFGDEFDEFEEVDSGSSSSGPSTRGSVSQRTRARPVGQIVLQGSSSTFLLIGKALHISGIVSLVLVAWFISFSMTATPVDRVQEDRFYIEQRKLYGWSPTAFVLAFFTGPVQFGLSAIFLALPMKSAQYPPLLRRGCIIASLLGAGCCALYAFMPATLALAVSFSVALPIGAASLIYLRRQRPEWPHLFPIAALAIITVSSSATIGKFLLPLVGSADDGERAIWRLVVEAFAVTLNCVVEALSLLRFANSTDVVRPFVPLALSLSLNLIGRFMISNVNKLGVQVFTLCLLGSLEITGAVLLPFGIVLLEGGHPWASKQRLWRAIKVARHDISSDVIAYATVLRSAFELAGIVLTSTTLITFSARHYGTVPSALLYKVLYSGLLQIAVEVVTIITSTYVRVSVHGIRVPKLLARRHIFRTSLLIVVICFGSFMLVGRALLTLSRDTIEDITGLA